jgi:HSP20 family protein
MTRLTRWEPFRETRRMHDMLDRIMDRAFLDFPLTGGLFEGGVPIDIYQTDDEVVIKATTPGLKPDDLHVTITGDTLNLRGEVSEERENEGVQYHVRERIMRSFSRSISLPTAVDADKAKAEFENGVLTLTLPKVEGVKPKTITVKAKK